MEHADSADSTVQYGESKLPDRSAYSGQLSTSHALTLNGLQANRTYYFEVVSRDAAGNVAVDNNSGAFYTFTTPPAVRPPWLDNLETGAPGWTVVPDTSFGTELNWTLGTPDNLLETSAYSGTNAWGSNLDGQQADAIGTFYSPFVIFTSFSQATLTFYGR